MDKWKVYQWILENPVKVILVAVGLFIICSMIWGDMPT